MSVSVHLPSLTVCWLAARSTTRRWEGTLKTGVFVAFKIARSTQFSSESLKSSGSPHELMGTSPQQDLVKGSAHRQAGWLARYAGSAFSKKWFKGLMRHSVAANANSGSARTSTSEEGSIASDSSVATASQSNWAGYCERWRMLPLACAIVFQSLLVHEPHVATETSRRWAGAV
eukprot:scaffold70749_cov62-Phaeocystis_antarctica.AAC.6